MVNCFFIGHRDAPQNILHLLYSSVLKHITEKGVTDFYVGNHGHFDSMAASCVIEAKKIYPDVALHLLICYHPAQHPVLTPKGFDDTYYPFEIPEHPRTAILKANIAMIQQSDFLIAYAGYTGNSRSLVEYALRYQQKNRIFVDNLFFQ